MAARVKFPHFLGVCSVLATDSGVASPETFMRDIPRAVLEATLPDWRMGRRNRDEVVKTTPLSTADNTRALSNLTGWLLRFNEMTKRVEVTRNGMVIPEDDHENIALTLFGDCVVRAGMGRNDLGALVDAVASSNRYHPVKDWILATQWDGVSRLHLWRETLVMVDSGKSGFRDRLMDKWALQCIGALMEKRGISSPGILVLAGGQYIGKSYWFAHLCPLKDTIGTGLNLDPSNKDSVLKAVRYWIGELGELDSTTRRAEVSMLKAFLSNNVDVVRLPYARRDTSFRRRSVFGGTVNGTGFLVDETGNRRFWVMDVLRCDVLSPDVMQQVWAEYMALYQSGQRWHLEADTLAELNASNLDHTAVDPLRELIANRFDWGGIEWGAIDLANYRAFPDVAWMSATDICIRVGTERPTKAESTRAGSIVRDLYRVSRRVEQGNLERKSNGVKLLAVPKRQIRGA